MMVLLEVGQAEWSARSVHGGPHDPNGQWVDKTCVCVHVIFTNITDKIGANGSSSAV